jgi:hypothetical protein
MKPLFHIKPYLFLILAFGLTAQGCRKAFLAGKPSTNLLVPNSLTVFQELLDNTQVMNISPALGEVSADNYYLLYTTWIQLDTKEYNAYIWAPDLYDGQGLVSDWDIPYQQVFYANTVLQGLAGIQPDSTDQAEWNMLKGWALFSRAFAFYNIVQLFAKPYDSATAATDPGIPIRLSPDINEMLNRSSLQATYTQILADLNAALNLLPAAIPFSNLNRPSKQAVHAFLARIYLSIRDYPDAWINADIVINGGYSTLIVYSSLDTNALIPVANNVPEIIYQSNFPQPGNGNLLEGLICTGCIVDTNLIASYAFEDLRLPTYYLRRAPDTFILKGSYSGTIFPFSGLALDEMYLIRAECGVRVGNVVPAINDLNLLMARAGVLPYPNNMSAAETLDTILVERRKELAFRGIRWSDLRRLNQEGRNITLYRNINGRRDTLPPGSNLYTMPIPPDVIQ